MSELQEFLKRALIDSGLASAEQVAQAERNAQENNSSLEEAMATMPGGDAKRIAVVKAQLCEAPFVDIEHYEVALSNCSLAPRAVAERFCFFPLFVQGGVATVGMRDPLDLSALDQVRESLKCEVEAVLCEAKQLRTLISKAYSLGGREAGPGLDLKAKPDGRDDTHADESGPVVAAVNAILKDAAMQGASDVHISPDGGEQVVRYRIDGVLQKRQGPGLALHQKIVQRIKVMARLDLTQTRRPQDGKFRFALGDREIDIRVSILPTVTGENVVMRLLAGQGRVPTLLELGMSPEMVKGVEEIVAQPYGMFLATGPTGSGKTTTLYSALGKLNTPDVNIVTVEDPVEIRVPLVRQVQANAEIGMTFAGALRSILRQDPDVVLVGEIRDSETATMALQAALTGHFVLSTLHTNDAAGAMDRLKDLGVQTFVIRSAVKGILAQRLVRRVCPACAEPAEPDAGLLAKFGLGDGRGFVEGRGCGKCMKTGFSGRVGLYELMVMSAGVRSEMDGSPEGSGHDYALMWEDGLAKARVGLTTLAEVARSVEVTARHGGRTPTHRLRRSA